MTNIRTHNSNTGTHPDGAVNTEAATAAGYTPETVQLMAALPYLTLSEHEMSLQLLPSTYPVTYLGKDLNEGYFRSYRELLNDAEMPPTALQLTWSELYGVVFIYDTPAKLLRPWKPFDNPDEEDGYSHVAGASPREVLSPLINDYRKLRHLVTPGGPDFSGGLFADSGGMRPNGWREDEQKKWDTAYAVWQATQKLRDIYLECGWDVDATEQRDFNLEEYLARRDVYWRDVVEPPTEAEQNARSAE
ncbi:hypothetical protein F5Y09DRAFT_323377 [Xylaria sp. FL1042]|nr:hypothetical protein F5Y09DRAFT_323377 [Xylaria sp. FL1042]